MSTENYSARPTDRSKQNQNNNTNERHVVPGSSDRQSDVSRDGNEHQQGPNPNVTSSTIIGRMTFTRALPGDFDNDRSDPHAAGILAASGRNGVKQTT